MAVGVLPACSRAEDTPSPSAPVCCAAPGPAAAAEGGAMPQKEPASSSEPSEHARLVELVTAAQKRLTTLAERRGHLDVLAPAITRLGGLVEHVWATPLPPPAPQANKSKVMAALGKPRWRLRTTRRHCRWVSPRPPRPPPKPYAPLRWPPLRVTLAALRGQPAQAGSAQHPPMPPPRSQLQRSLLAAGGLGCRGEDGAEDLMADGDDFLNLVEVFEDKLGLMQRKRRPHESAWAGRYTRKGQNAAAAVSAMKQPGSLPRGAKRAWRRGQTAASCKDSHGPRPRELERTLRGSKCEKDYAELWPYK